MATQKLLAEAQRLSESRRQVALAFEDHRNAHQGLMQVRMQA